MVGNPDAIDEDGAKATAASGARAVFLAGSLFIIAVALLICLLPEANRDFYWQLRTGDEILRTGRLPHADSYSWERAGTPWYVPEWLSFVLLSAAFNAGAYFATWLMMVALTCASALLVWTWLARRVHPVAAMVMTSLMLMAMALTIQERPYLFTYVFLAISIRIIQGARSSTASESGEAWKRLLWLLPLAAIWANFHQGVTILPVLLGALAAGDLVTGLWQRSPSAMRSAKSTAGIAAGCALALMVSPYGWGIYKNVAVTVGNPVAMRSVIEWSPITWFPAEAFAGFYIMAAVVALGYLGSRRPRDIGELLAVAGVACASVLHVRDIPLFAIVAAVFSAEHVESAASRFLVPAANRLGARRARLGAAVFSIVVAFTFLGILAQQCLGELRAELTPGAAVTPEAIGEAVMMTDWYPLHACLYMKSEGFPDGLRLYNDYGFGGYLIWALPNDRVFMDGRNDIYAGTPLLDYLAMNDFNHPAVRAAAVDRYPFDCVITGSPPQAAAFSKTPGWALVYVDEDDRYIFLRDIPAWHDLIVRCQRDVRAAWAGHQ